MLLVDLNRLARDGRASVDADIPPDDTFWTGLELRPAAPLEVRLEAQQAGPDVVVRGRVAGEFRLECRRCLEPVVAGVDEEVGLLYKAGEVDADEPEDVLPLPDEATLDVVPAVRELLLVAVPSYVICRKDCRGLCPRCGTNLNEGTCGCTSDEVEERWAPLRQLKRED